MKLIKFQFTTLKLFSHDLFITIWLMVYMYYGFAISLNFAHHVLSVWDQICSNKKRSSTELLFVIRLGLEPRTPSLKGMCSTC